VALIKSISGIRGTIGGVPGESLTAIDIVKFTASFGNIIAERREDKSQPTKIIVGRDGRISGEMVSQLVINTLVSLGVNVIDLGLSTTPTVEIATKNENADGGIIITASHNPPEYNGFKLKGSFGGPLQVKYVMAIEELIPDSSTIDPDKLSLENFEKDGLLQTIDLETMYVNHVNHVNLRSRMSINKVNLHVPS
jgi:phosphomannomutase